jgi:hypothetical protein
MRKKELQELRVASTRAKKCIKSTPSAVRLEAQAELDRLALSRKHLESQIARDKEVDMRRKIERATGTLDGLQGNVKKGALNMYTHLLLMVHKSQNPRPDYSKRDTKICDSAKGKKRSRNSSLHVDGRGLGDLIHSKTHCTAIAARGIQVRFLEYRRTCKSRSCSDRTSTSRADPPCFCARLFASGR